MAGLPVHLLTARLPQGGETVLASCFCEPRARGGGTPLMLWSAPRNCVEDCGMKPKTLQQVALTPNAGGQSPAPCSIQKRCARSGVQPLVSGTAGNTVWQSLARPRCGACTRPGTKTSVVASHTPARSQRASVSKPPAVWCPPADTKHSLVSLTRDAVSTLARACG